MRESVDAGAHLTLFSGDKLLGGPQAGIVVGGAELVGRIARHPLARAIRIDKMTLAALNATLRSYVRGAATDELPILRMMAATLDELADVAKQWSREIDSEVVDGRTVIGGGSAPGQTLSTRRLMITARLSVEAVAEKMRRYDPPVIGRIEEERFFLDPRTVLPEERDAVAGALVEVAGLAKSRAI